MSIVVGKKLMDALQRANVTTSCLQSLCFTRFCYCNLTFSLLHLPFGKVKHVLEDIHMSEPRFSVVWCLLWREVHCCVLYFSVWTQVIICVELKHLKSMFPMLIDGRAHIEPLQANKQWIRILTLLCPYAIFTFSLEPWGIGKAQVWILSKINKHYSTSLCFAAISLYLSLEQALPHHLIISKHYPPPQTY